MEAIQCMVVHVRVHVHVCVPESGELYTFMIHSSPLCTHAFLTCALMYVVGVVCLLFASIDCSGTQCEINDGIMRHASVG